MKAILDEISLAGFDTSCLVVCSDGQVIIPDSWPEEDRTSVLAVVSDRWDAALLTAEANKKAGAIQAEKVRARDAGFLVDGVLFDSDQSARISYAELAPRLSSDPTFTTPWKASAGVWVTMDAALFARVQAAGTAHIRAAFAWQEARDAEVAAILAQAAAGTMNQAEAVAALRGVPDRFL